MFRWVRREPSRILFFAPFLGSIGLVGVIFFFLLIGSIPIFRAEGLGFLFGTQWLPGQSYGALPMIYGTVIVTGIAIAIAFPLGLGTAIVTSEMLRGPSRLAVKGLMELLAGIPGVVYGLLAIAFLTAWIRDFFGVIDGNTILAAGAILGVMVLPTVMTLSDDAMRAVPRELREQALALGLNRTETVLFVVMPGAFRGMVGAVLLGVSRAMGETIAVMLVIGGIDRIPTPFYNIFASAQTITSKLGREAAEAIGAGLHWNAMLGLGLVLFLLVMAVTLIGDLAIIPSRSDGGRQR